MSLLVLMSVAPLAEARICSGGEDCWPVDPGRPEWTALERLKRRYGYRITYEDPRYRAEADLLPATAAARRLRAKAPISVPPEPPGTWLSPRSRIEAILRADGHDAFEVIEHDGQFHVVPRRARDESGEWATVSPLLDASISIPAESRDGEEFLTAITLALREATNIKVHWAILGSSLRAFRTTRGVTNEPAREVLCSFLAEVRPDLTWTVSNFEGHDEFAIVIDPLP